MKAKLSLRQLAVILSLFPLLIGCGTSIQGGQRGLQFKPFHGGIQQKIHEDGFKWHLPWNGLVIYDVRWQSKREPIDVLSRDNLHVNMRVSMRLRPNIGELYELHMEIGPKFYEDVVQPAFIAISQQVLSSYNHDEISERIAEIQDKIVTALHEMLNGKHLDINSIIIEDVSFPKEVADAVEVKLAKKQELFQKEFELEIARKDAEIRRIEAEGLAESQGVIKDHLTDEYLQFLLIQIQQKLVDSPNKTFIFIPVGPGGVPLLMNLEPQK
ncbi:prohibitin family protein [Candidatus Poribacteria bacterium]|nr:prohibitin family protein [Candidatus Poribacteria bacterium]